MKKKFIFSTILVGLLYFMTVQTSEAFPTAPQSNATHTIHCDPSTNTCVTVYILNRPIPVEGTLASIEIDPKIDFSSCGSNETHYTDIFVHGWGNIGDGMGLNEINGFYDPNSPNEIKFSTETNLTVTNNYSTWLANASNN